MAVLGSVLAGVGVEETSLYQSSALQRRNVCCWNGIPSSACAHGARCC